MALAGIAAGAALAALPLGTYAAPPAPTVSGVTPSSGSTAGGFNVNVHGANLKAAQSVTFDGLAGSVVSSSPSVLTVTVPNDSANCPSGSCAVNVVVTTSSGNSGTTGNGAFTYVNAGGPPPPPPNCNAPSGTTVFGGPTGGTPYSQPAGSAWVQKPGAANDVATGGGQTYVIGTNGVNGGFGVYKWTGSGWAPIPGGLVDIAAGPDGSAWGVNSFQQIYHWSGGAWHLLPGSGYDIAVGSGGSVFVIGTNKVNGGCGIYKWNGSAWVTWSGGGTHIAVGSNDNPWVTNNNNSIYAYNGGWRQMSGAAVNIAATAGSVWVLGTNLVTGGNGIYYFNGTGWVSVAGGAASITVGSNKLPWVTNEGQTIYQRI